MDSIETKDIEIPEEIITSWQKITNIIAELAGVTVSLIMKVNPPYMEVFRSSQTKDNPYNVGDKEKLPGLYCEEVIKTDQKLLVPNALKDEKWKNNPDIELGMISYLGFPLKWPDGDFFGTICILDTKENKFSDRTETLLKEFKEFIELHLKNLYQNQEFKKSERKLKTILNSIGDGVITTDENLCIDIMNPVAEMLTGYKIDEAKGKKLEEVFDLIHSVTGESKDFPMEEVLVYGKTINLPDDTTLIDKKGHRYQIKESAAPIQEGEDVIQGAVMVFSNVSKDILTGLYTYSYMEETIRKLDNKKHLPLSIIVTDINGLKLFNDTYGHKEGDKLLVVTADLLLSCVSKKDIVARWGGDDFIILLSQTKEEEAKKICAEITDKCEETKVNEVNVSLGIGAATKKELQQDIYKVLHRAEDRMLVDKLMIKSSSKNIMVQNMLKILGAKSYETKEHAERMRLLSLKMGKKVGLSNQQLTHLSLLANLHDIGKINIAEKILKSPTALSNQEWEVIKEHPIKGFAIAQSIEEFAPVAYLILAHHEHWNGGGYPRGLKGEETPLLARIISIIDAYDVMTNGRPYKVPISKEEAIKELKRCAGSQFDPELVEIFVEEDIGGLKNKSDIYK
ncbi:MAG: diguanylate cyclase [Halanaerobiales bacterium]|nr:diguanylate cyclase [Halanaerobiales bacterium]